MLRRGKKVKQSKDDVSSAFKRVPMRRSQKQYLAIVFMIQSVMMLAARNSALFGAVAAVWAWHRIDNFYICLLQAGIEASSREIS